MARGDRLLCKACQLCRKRKVKCDGREPSCTPCVSHGRTCTYGRDRRHTSRTSESTVRQMSDEIANLHHIVSSLTGPRKDLDGDQRASLQGTDATMTSNTSTLASTNTFHRASTARGDSEDVSNAEINALVSAESTLSMHGPTSSFRDTLSEQLGGRIRTSTPRVFADASERASREAEWRLQLFANAALERQKEHAYMSNPQFELDGLDSLSAFYLMDCYWRYQNPAYLVTYRPAVMHSLANQGTYANKLLLNSIYYAGAILSGQTRFMDDATDPSTLGYQFFRRFQELLPAHLEVSSIANISALIVMSSSVLTRGKQTLAYLYSGLAHRIIVDLGLHVDPEKVEQSSYSPKLPTYSMTSADIEQQRRVFWGAFIHDRFQCLYFGRSPGLRLIRGLEPSKEVLDSYDELELWQPLADDVSRIPKLSSYVVQPKYSVSNRTSLIELAEITSDIIETLYTPNMDLFSQEDRPAMFESIRKRLNDWSEQLPKHLILDPQTMPVPPPHRFYPHLIHQTLYILLYKPFLPGGHLRRFSHMQEEADLSCISSALKIYAYARAYREAFSLQKAPFLYAYTLFCAATVMPVKSGNGKGYLDVIKFFWTSFKEIQENTNSGLKKPMVIFRHMLERAGLDFDAIQTNLLRRSDQQGSQALDSHSPNLSVNSDVDLQNPTQMFLSDQETCHIYQELFSDSDMFNSGEFDATEVNAGFSFGLFDFS